MKEHKKAAPDFSGAAGLFGLEEAVYFFLAAFLAGAAFAGPAARFSSMAAWAAARRATGTR